MDVQFDAQHLAEFRKAMSRGWDAYEEFVMNRSHAVDIATNMDW
jgi:hypothetical protein